MTPIEWTDDTWNPVVGCSVVSPGCTNCYAMRMAARQVARGSAHYAGTTQPSKAGPVWTGKVALAPDRTLLAPLRWEKSRTIFVNSMGDLFHEAVPDEWIDKVFAVMALTPQHRFQVLTKRSARMREYMTRLSTMVGPSATWDDFFGSDLAKATREVSQLAGHPAPGNAPLCWLDNSENAARYPKLVQRTVGFPPRNVWLGVSVEDQARADERVPDLLATPAAVRFVSCEPLLGPVNWRRITQPVERAPGLSTVTNALTGHRWDSSDLFGEDLPDYAVDMPSTAKLDWVIVGGESGPGARPMDLRWARSLRDQCAAAGVPFFMKQMGGPVKARMPAIPDDLMIREMPR